jgi:hypothetical protein
MVLEITRLQFLSLRIDSDKLKLVFVGATPVKYGSILILEVVKMSFKEQLQTLRKSRGLSQEKLAEIIGISRQAVAKWEIGKSYPILLG